MAQSLSAGTTHYLSNPPDYGGPQPAEHRTDGDKVDLGVVDV